MKIALCSSYVPFVAGGYRNIVEWLQAVLELEGHNVERIYLPQVDAPELLFRQMAAYRWVDLSSADRIICFRPPAHVIRHPNKVIWFIHHVRAFYDLWATPYRGFEDDMKHRGIRKALHAVDAKALKEARRVFSNSRVVSDRLRRFNKIDSEVLYPPLFQPERFHCRTYGGQVVYVGRLEHHKRQHLFVDAMRYTRTQVSLRLCGSGSGSDYPDYLHRLAEKYGLDDRVVIDNRWIGEDEKVEQLADCLAVAYAPVDEDSYGYSTLEAGHAAKAIITTSDSGGVLELVEHGVNGFVCDPSPQALAEAMDELYLDRKKAQQLGVNGRLRLEDLNISWPHVIERLLT